MIFLNLHAGPIFLNLHAGSISSHTATNPRDVSFVLWTDEKPVAARFAVAKGDWMMATRFADLVHAIPAGEVIVILDTCEAGAVSPLFIDENPHDDERRPESVITSSGAGQFANFAADHSIALYSQQLATAVANSTGTLRQALDTAAAKTTEAAIPICDALRDTLLGLSFDPLACRQTPTTHDPQQLLTRISLGKSRENVPEGKGN